MQASDIFRVVDRSPTRFNAEVERADSGRIRAVWVEDKVNGAITKATSLKDIDRVIGHILSKEMTAEEAEQAMSTAKRMLHCVRSSMRSRWLWMTKADDDNTLSRSFNTRSMDYGKVCGYLEAMNAMGHLRLPYDEALAKLESLVLSEEGFRTDHKCQFCKDRYRVDDRTMLERGAVAA